MSARDSETRFCEVCGAPLARHPEGGLCTRCLALYSLGKDESPDAEPGERAPPGVVAPQESKAHIGDYELLEEIAHGGMGVVYRARQISLNRIVAVKMVLCGQFAGKGAFERFRAEAETAARLQHPNIVAIHTIGEADGQPYYSMDYVPGRSLAEVVRESPLPARAAALYVRKIAQAVHYAHTQGVLHRDLKPANVLIDENDEPRITDFGIARRLSGDSELTLTGQVLGSPNFMPPEQGVGRKVKLGPTADVYGLGALLYYLVTARPPFMAETFEATLAQVLNNDPVNPRQLNPGLPRDLETICLKCLEKDPARRYASAQELADELERFLNKEPIRARPLGTIGKTWRWCRRKPALAGMAASLVIAIVLGFSGIAIQWRKAVHNAEEARLNLYAADMVMAQGALEAGEIARARQLLDDHRPAPGQRDLRGWEWRYLWGLCRSDELTTLGTHVGEVLSAAWSPDGRMIASVGGDMMARVWEVQTGKEVFATRTGGLGNYVAFFADGCRFATGGWGHKPTIVNWRNNERSPLPSIPVPDLKSWCVALDPKQEAVALADNVGNLYLFKCATRTWSRLPAKPMSLVTGMKFTPDGGKLLFAGRNQSGVQVCSLGDPPASRILRASERGITALAVSPDGKRVATGDYGVSSRITIWDIETGEDVMPPISGQRGNTGAVAFSPDGTKLAFGAEDQMIRIWDLKQNKLEAALKGHSYDIWSVSFSPDGKRIASAGRDGTVRIWKAQAPESQTSRWRVPANTWIWKISENGRYLVRATHDGKVWLLDTASLRESQTVQLGLPRVDFLGLSDDGRMMAIAENTNSVGFYDLKRGEKVRTVSTGTNMAYGARTYFSSGGELAAMAFGQRRFIGPFAVVEGPVPAPAFVCPAQEGNLKVVRLERGDVPSGVRMYAIYCVAFSPDRKQMYVASYGRIFPFDTQTERAVYQFTNQTSMVKQIAFSQDGRRVLSVSIDGGTVYLWDAATRQPVGFFQSRLGGIATACLHPDGERVAFAVMDRIAIRHLGIGSGRELAILSGHSNKVRKVHFVDENTLVSCDDAGDVILWRAASKAEIEASEKTGRFAPRLIR